MGEEGSSRVKRPYRLGLDLGANSLGWSVIWLDRDGHPTGLGPAGVRIYADGRDPQSKTSNAVTRRVARGARRRRDRYLERRKKLMEALVAAGLMPGEESARKALETLDPYALRARGLNERLPLHQLGRALFHINQRRGFKSNRKTDGQNEEKGAIAKAGADLRQAMLEAGARTLGEYLALRHSRREPVRARNISTGAKAAYAFYPQRVMLEDEFRLLWQAQAKFHPELTNDLYETLHEIVFYQRPLKSPPVGKCALDPAKGPDDLEGFRCSWAHPLAQRYRILQEVTNLAVGPVGETKRPLAPEERQKVYLQLLSKKTLSFDGMRRLLKLSAEQIFNLESERRSKLDGDQTAWRLGDEKRFGKTWAGFAPARQAEIVERLLEEQDEEALLAWLMAETKVEKDRARVIADSPLPDSHCRLGLRALKAVVPLMEAGNRYHEAAKAAGYDHARLPTGEIRDRLPYYGEILQDHVVGSGDLRDPAETCWGRLPNPTVHIGLNQLRRLVNALIKRHGPPAEIVVEMARDFKLSPLALRKLELEQAANQKKNDRRRKRLEDCGYPVNHGNLLRLRLWEELNEQDEADRACPFTGEKIGFRRLMSDEVEIEHLIPFSRSWDDSAANKTVSLRSANRAKGNRTPYEAFGSSPSSLYDWEQIAARARDLPGNKRWRFDPDAMQRFEAGGGFLARQLNETSWLARLARQYLGSITDPRKVWVVPGRLTALLRGKWGLNDLLDPEGGRKNRNDHRHHALDALVAGMTDRSLLQRMAREYDETRDRIEVSEPWSGFRQDAARALDAILVSHKPDHGTQGQLHEDTAYGLLEQAETGGNIVYRKPLTGLKETEIGRVRDSELRHALQEAVEKGKHEGKELPQVLQEFGEDWGKRHSQAAPGKEHGSLRHLRLLEVRAEEYLVPISDKGGQVYKAMIAGKNHCIDIVEMCDGRWEIRSTSVYQANQEQPDLRSLDEVGEHRLVMRVHKGDSIRLDGPGGPTYWLIHRLEPSSKELRLAQLHEAGALQKRHSASEEEDAFRWYRPKVHRLKDIGAVHVRIDEIGRPWRVSKRETRE
ncbi:MAG: type II CRISPR RNA-guided endonuclease Cas9 [Kiloniellales bacterium]